MRNVEVPLVHEPLRAEGNPAVLIRTGGGNAPALMGLRVLDRLNSNRTAVGLPKVDGIFPVSSERQIRMLTEEATDPRRVLADTTYAEIVKPHVDSHGKLSEHIGIVGNLAEDTKMHLMQRFGSNAGVFDSMSLGLGETVTHTPQDIIGVLDAGSRYPSTDHPDHYFFFPVLATELWQNFREEQLSYDPSVRISDESLSRAIDKMQNVENGYKKIYLPQIHSFSYLYVPENAEMSDKFEALAAQPVLHGETPIEYTPPMSPNLMQVLPQDDIERPSIFVMFSGTGSAIAETNKVASQIADAGYGVLVPESAVKFGDLTEENMERATVVSSPAVVSHPNVHGVLARPGFGTIWDAQNAGIEMMRPPYVQGDDHEMVVNGRTLDALRMGEELDPDDAIDSGEFRRNRIAHVHDAQKLKEKQVAKFGSSDGLSFVGDDITDQLGNPAAGQNAEISRAQEALVIPEPLYEGHRMTFRGRYDHVNKDVLDSLTYWDNVETDFREMNRPLTISMLDFGSGVMEFGSPTAHDFIDAAQERGHTVQVDAVDLNLPDQPNYPEVMYSTGIEDTHKQYDVVRMLHVGEYMSKDEYETKKVQLMEKVKEGGFFVETVRPQLTDSVGTMDLPYAIKITRKNTSGLNDSTYIPDGMYPKNNEELAGFESGPDKEGWQHFMVALRATGNSGQIINEGPKTRDLVFSR